LLGPKRVVLVHESVSLVSETASGVERIVIGCSDCVFARESRAFPSLPGFGEAFGGTVGVRFRIEAAIAHAVPVPHVMELEEPDRVAGIADRIGTTAALDEHDGLEEDGRDVVLVAHAIQQAVPLVRVGVAVRLNGRVGRDALV
jgi:hypothetical protein